MLKGRCTLSPLHLPNVAQTSDAEKHHRSAIMPRLPRKSMAEQQVQTSNSESQDSQLVLDYYQKVYGIGDVSVRRRMLRSSSIWMLDAGSPVDVLTLFGATEK